MRNDASGSISSLFQNVMNKVMSEVNVGFPCKVLSFDETTATANVQPLLKTTSSSPAPIQGIPIIKHKYIDEMGNIRTLKPYLQTGDVVFVVCADREIKNALKGSVTAPSSQRIHDINDAVIIGVL